MTIVVKHISAALAFAHWHNALCFAYIKGQFACDLNIMLKLLLSRSFDWRGGRDAVTLVVGCADVKAEFDHASATTLAKALVARKTHPMLFATHRFCCTVPASMTMRCDLSELPVVC